MLSKLEKKKIRVRLGNIYDTNKYKKFIDPYYNEIINLIENFNKKKTKKKRNISEKNSLLICYADSLYSKNQKSALKNFKKFFNKLLNKYFDSIHFLPFYPSSSDSGFAVKDHYKVDKKFGSWSDISTFTNKTNIMADIVINHSSARGMWFRNFLREKRPGKDYFLRVSNKFNTSKVIRPRDHQLLKKVDFFKKKNFIWRTFSPDQIDLNFKNPSVLLRFIKIMIHLINHGVTIFRLDAIAYLWKESGTKCINLYQTHEIVKLLRQICGLLKVQTSIVTETNLPEIENISYFGGKNDEANWIYNFTLPPLLIHALLFEQSKFLNKWSKKLPLTKPGNSYLNFIASHDGIGMRPVEGILNKKNLRIFFQRLRKNGSRFSYRKIQNKNKKVYEANITVFNALQKSDYDKNGKFFFERYVAAHSIMISFEGIPAIYFNSLFGTSNDEAKYVITGNNRDINRYKWNKENLLSKLKDNKSKQKIFYKNIVKLLEIKKKQKAFHPNAHRSNINLGSKIYCFKRISIDKKQTIICITNLSSKAQYPRLNKKFLDWKDLIQSKKNYPKEKKFVLKPFQTVWLSNI